MAKPRPPTCEAVDEYGPCSNQAHYSKPDRLCPKHYQRIKANGSPWRELPSDPFPENILARLEFQDDGCITDPSDRGGGYGFVRRGVPGVDSRVDSSHRAIWEYSVGPIPERYHLHHLCENPPCVNPDCLIPLSPEEHAKLHHPEGTHCGRGHERTEANTYIRKDTGMRMCRPCHREDVARRTQRTDRPAVDCPVCGNRFLVLVTGKIRKHVGPQGRAGSDCEGSGRLP